MKIIKGIGIGVFSLVMLGSLSLANGLNLNSFGSRAQAMGGAYVALADDFSAFYWNPAGMGFFNTMRFGVYATDIIPSGTYVLNVPVLGQVVNAATESKHYLGGLAAFTYPINSQLVVGLGVVTPSGLGSSWNGTDLAFLSSPDTTVYDYSSQIGMVTIAPSVAYRINDMISIGASFNLNYAMFTINQFAKFYLTQSLGQYTEEDTGWGVGGTFGLLFKPSASLSFGLTVKTPSKVSLNGTASISNFPLLGLPESSEVGREITWPMLVQGGVAFRPLAGLTITADLQWTRWSSIKTIVSDYQNSLWALLMGAGGRDEIVLNWADALQIRAGLEFMVTEAIALRLGYMYDPAPAPIETMNILLPSYNFNTITAGLGYSSGSLQFDLGFEYLMGQGRSLDFLTWYLDPTQYGDGMPGDFGMNIIVPSLSVSYKF